MEAPPTPPTDRPPSAAVAGDPARLIAFTRELLGSATREEVLEGATRRAPALLSGSQVSIEALASQAGSSSPAGALGTLLPLPTQIGSPLALRIVTQAASALDANQLPWASAIADAIALALDGIERLVQERSELSQTRDFLQRVIESSVDGIVSADLRGHILVYNQAAARIFGYDRDEVLGRMNVESLYPPGMARDVMKRIRSQEQGGRGRLTDYCVDMLTNRGERIPVSLSASLVLDGRRPVGTVGIFTDVRDKLALEAGLTRAQRELQSHEKQAAIAELAGAAAHELNQPLTAVMGYAEYLKRTVSGDVAQERAIDVILGETERMANIVRKVGRITRYETKPYVGGAKIVDIEASSAVTDE
jgi:PAS domain S-box-containing protein